MKKTVIIDYESGNLFSVFHVCKLLGLDPLISSDAGDLRQAAGVILPGVGAFGDAMENLRNTGMAEAISEYIYEDKPFLGICLGMQLLFEYSEEFGENVGLGLVKGHVKRFNFDDDRIKVPHVGWNRISKPEEKNWKDSLFKNVHDGDYMYFVHSYYAEATDERDIMAFTDYEGKKFCSAIMKNNIFATQFHPEKSGISGLSVVKEFAALLKGIK